MTILRRFLVLLKPHYRYGWGIAALLLLSSAFTVGTPFLYKELVDDGILKSDMPHLVRMVLLIAASMALQELLYLGQTRLSLAIRSRVFARLRMDLYGHLLKLPQSFFAGRHKGGLLSRITSDVDAVQNLLLEKYVGFAQNVLVGAAVIVVLCTIDWRMVLAAALFLPLLYLLYRVFRSRIAGLSRRSQEKQEGLMERLHEDLSMVKAIQSYADLEERIGTTGAYIEEAEEAKRRLNLRYAGALSSTTAINVIGVAVIWGMGGAAVIDGRMSMGTLIAISFYLTYVVNLFFNAYYTLMGFQRSKPAAERIFEILDTAPAIADRPDAVELEAAGGSVVFRDVRFGYGEGKPVLDRVSFELRPGQLVGLAGASGEGKTTLANLLLRFHDPHEGTIAIGGRDIREVRLASLRRSVAIIPQEDYLFNMSLRDNIRMGRSGAGEAEFLAACRAASVDGFAASLEFGYDTVIGENGMRLSSGQRKRVSIARALLENPHVVIFDEATSVLDERTERDILATAEKLAEGRIVILITHNPGNLAACSVVLEVRDGDVGVYNGRYEYRSEVLAGE